MYANITTYDASSKCLGSADNDFGPAVLGCRNGFDFTLLFEQTILSLVPSLLLLLLIPFRIYQLYTTSTKTIREANVYLKFVSISTSFGGQN